MNRKSKGMGLGIVLGAALGVALGVMAGHIAIWLGIGVAIGMALGSTIWLRTLECPECAVAHKAHAAKSENYRGEENGATFGTQ